MPDDMSEDVSVWLAVAQGAATVALLVALADLSLAFAARFARQRYERAALGRSLEVLDQRVQAASVRRKDRQAESLSWNGLRKFQVARKQVECEGICSFYLKPHDGSIVVSRAARNSGSSRRANRYDHCERTTSVPATR